MLFSVVSCLRSIAFVVFGARRTGGGGDAVEAGRHPPADGRTPETTTQRAVGAEEPSLEPLDARDTTGSHEEREEGRNMLSEPVAGAFKQTKRPIRAWKILAGVIPQRDTGRECFVLSDLVHATPSHLKCKHWGSLGQTNELLRAGICLRFSLPFSRRLSV